MKIEKVDENKVKIILSLEELEMRNISISELQMNNSLARNFFKSLIEESNLDEDFIDNEDSQLFIEAAADNTNTFVLTITKTDSLPDINSYQKKGKVQYRIDSRLYEFNSLDAILDFCKIAKSENLFFGTNTLYKYQDKYFLLFSESAIRNKRFIKTYVMMSEFCSRYYAYDMHYATISEKGSVIIQNRALHKLSKI